VADAKAAQAALAAIISPDDVVLIKGSNGVGLSRVVAALGRESRLGGAQG
jgi:UDP-N-acetylmuramoyl-tripeptide--D-alanyl-D-alanine ligase